MMFDFQEKKLSGSLSVDQLRTCLGTVEAAITLNSSIRSAIVRLTQNKLVGYVVTAPQVFDVTEIYKHLQNLIPLEWTPKVFIPLVALPFNSNGQIDELTLSNIPAIDQHLATKWEELIRQQLDVENAAVVISDRPKQELPLHLSDLLPNWVDTQNVHTPNRIEPITNSSDNSQEIKSDRIAISHGEPLKIHANAPLTLIDSLKQAASKSPELGVIYIALDGAETKQTYPELLADAQSVLAGLRQLGLQPQDKVIFQLKNNSDFLAAFWGCILGGFIPVPLSVASDYQELNNNVKKLHYTWELLDQPIILTNQHLVLDIQSIANFCPMNNMRIVNIEALLQHSPDLICHHSQPDDLAMLLLTSGSTGIPKAVMQTHSSIMAQAQTTIQMNDFSNQDVYLNWMPLDHVGGIIFAHCNAVYISCQQVHVPTDFILNSPLRWIDLISSHKATITWAPNFAYNLVSNCIHETDGINQRHWDLSSMRYVLSAGEAIVPRVARQFLQLLKPYGLPETALHSAWGMAETCSGAFYSDRFLYKSNNDDEAFAEVGPPVPAFSVRIVNLKGDLVCEGTIGLVQVQGAIVTTGYYRNPSANQEAFSADGWFNTGDLGILHEGRLTITGRQKDVIIINGTNYYSHEIEAIVEEIKGVSTSYTAAVGVRDGGDTDRLVIFFSPIANDEMAIVKLIQTMRERVLQSSGIYPDHVIPVAAISIPKTPIGKIQRSQLKQQFEAGEFNHIIKQFDILAANSNTIPNWFFRKAWHRQNLRSYAVPASNRSVLIFLDRLGLGESLCQTLISEGQTCIKVEIGSEFTKFSAQHFAIAPNNANHYHQLLDSVAKDSLALTDILHLWTYNESSGEISSVEELEQAQECGLYSLLFLAQALVQINNQAPIKFQVVSSHAQAVMDNDAIAYEKGTISGFIKTIPQENPWIKSKHIDLTITEPETNKNSILAELTSNSNDQEIAYRQGNRWISRLEKINFAEQEKQEIPFKHGGIYLLTGGLGGIGVEIAKYLLNQYQARLILVGKTALPERNTWETHLQQNIPIANKIKTLQSLEQLTGEVTYESVDICDPIALQQIVNQNKTNWNSNLDGIIHLAGIYHEATLAEETQSQISATLKPKVAGTWILHQLLNDNPQAIFINFSSIAGFFSGAAIGAYASANSFLEGFSHYLRHQKGIKSYCFAWSTWEETGISKGYQMKELIRARGYCSMLVQQGIASLITALHHDQEQLLIGLDGSNPYIRSYLHNEPVEIKQLIAYIQTQKPISISELTKLSINDAYGVASHCQFAQLDEISLTETGAIDYSKLASRDKTNQSEKKYILPRNAVEQQISRIWQEILKISQIGIEDNFFELGGQSLTATQVISRIREVLRVDLQLSTFFKMPTIASLADAMLKQSSQPAQLIKIAELRERLNQMSPEEVQSLLRAKQASTLE